MPQVLTIGETMVALAPGTPGALRYVQEYRPRPAGAESNVAVGLAKLGVSVGWISRLGADEFGCFVRNQCRAEGVDCSGVALDPLHRTGVMFKELGVGETKVFYYRENSAASHMTPADVERCAPMFEGAQILHLTGITPVLSESCRATVLAAMALAEERGLRISFDPNIRKKLWQGQDYTPLLRDLALRSGILLLGLEEGTALFGTREPDALLQTLFTEGRAELVAIKNGAAGALVAARGAQRFEVFQIPPYPCRCVEPIGAGDGFNAGFLAGVVQGAGVQRAGQMGAICGALATQCPGDVEGYPDAAQMQTLLEGGAVVYR